MKLTNEQQQKLIEELNQTWKNKVCEICGDNKWSIDDILFELREFHGGKTVLGSGAIKPLVSLACNTCGNTKLMNAIKLGVVDPKNPSGDEKLETESENPIEMKGGEND